MLVVHGNKTPPGDAQSGVVAIGNFDGVHRGHQVLVKQTRDTAQRLGVRAGVIVFEPHPREFFAPDNPHFRLTPLAEKLRLFELYGLDFTIVLDFSLALAQLSAQQFISDVLVKRFKTRHVVVGYDFSFGKGRTGTVETLSNAGLEHGFGVTIVPAQTGAGSGNGALRDDGLGDRSGAVFSSSSIRRALLEGNVASAGSDLGHWWRIVGTVIHGEKIGGELGFPTANIELAAGAALAFGVYAVRVWVGQTRFDGAAYFGARPTVIEDGQALLEVTIFNFDGDLYGRELSVEFIDFVRPDKTFSTLDDLKLQIENDCARVRDILKNAGEWPDLNA